MQELGGVDGGFFGVVNCRCLMVAMNSVLVIAVCILKPMNKV
jgi:hypothetical protein